MADPVLFPFPLTNDNIIDVMTHGYYWQTGYQNTITWSISDGFYDEAWTNPQEVVGHLRSMFDVFSWYTNVNFEYVGYWNNPSTAYSIGADINVSMDGSQLLFDDPNVWAMAFFPNSTHNYQEYAGAPGDVYLNLNSEANYLPSYEPGSAGWFVFMHEIGHSLGLKHPHDDGGTGRPTFSSLGIEFLDEDFATVMSYNDDYGFNNISWDPATPMALDVLALQYLYGKNLEINADDTVFDLESYDFYYTIWDPSGNDTVDASSARVGWSVELPEYEVSDLVDTKIGLAVPLNEIDLDAPQHVVWLMGDIENAAGSIYADALYGNRFDNVLNGGPGADQMEGGDGSDIYYVDHIADVVYEVNANAITGGNDTVYSILTNYTLPTNVEYGGIRTSGGANLIGNALNNILTAGLGDNLLNGGAGSDLADYSEASSAVTVSLAIVLAQATGGSGTDTLVNIENLFGSDFDDQLTGNAGDNVIYGGLGADTMDGGAGNDMYWVDNMADLTVERGADPAEIDVVTSTVTRTLGANLENLTLFGTEAINGSGNALANRITGNGAANNLSGAAGADTLVGGSGADTLNGGSGADRMEGSFGGDVYIVDDPMDVVVELASQGTDRVSVGFTYTLGANVENLTLSGSASIDGTGNELANLLQGNAGGNRLTGLAGNDTLTGNTGDDTLDGGTGSDYMVGQEGDDTYYIDSSGDQTIESYPTFGIDHAITSVNRTISTNLENLTLAGAAALGSGNGLANRLTGNELANTLNGVGGDDTIRGGAGNDTLNGGLGADRMEGGAGNDVYAVDTAGDVVVEGAGEGIDRVSSTVSWVLGSEVENLTLAGTAAINGTGNALANVITGTAAANAIDGSAGADTLSGFDGNDTLTGGAGSDRLTGGNGADRFRFVTTGEGTDTITDFASGSDKILINAANFGLVAGSTANLVVNGNPGSGAAVFLYTSATGSLAFDGDGNGAGAAVPLAFLQNKPPTLSPDGIVLGP